MSSRRHVHGWDASVVECVVEPVAPRQHLVDRRVDLAVGGDVAGNEQRLTACSANAFGDLLAGFLLDIRQPDVCAVSRQLRCGSLPDPGGTTSHESYLPVETFRASSPPFPLKRLRRR